MAEVRKASIAPDFTCTLAAVALLLSAPAQAQAGGGSGAAHSKLVKPGSRWTVPSSTRLERLTIGANAVVRAPDGESVTLTVNGVERDLKPGTYRGDVVLTVSESTMVTFKCGPGPMCAKVPPEPFRAAVYVDNGSYLKDRSVPAAVAGGLVNGKVAKDVTITSRGALFNGIMVAGNSSYTIDHPRIDLTGNGANDFDGYASGIMASDHARVLVEKADITTHGVARGAIFAGDHSTITVNDSTIRVYNGTLPAGYEFTLLMGKMLEVPWMLGITGNARATLLVGYGTAYYNNDRIIAQGWGALSTDGVKRTRLYVRNSTIETLDSGYGSYSLGDSWNHFMHCRFRVADMALIMSNGGSGTFTQGTVVNSRRFGVIIHSPAPGPGTLQIDRGSVFNTKSTAIQVKGVGANIVVDHASLHAGNGILIQAMVNDDPFAPIPKAGTDTPVTVAFRHVALRGDIINSRTNQGEMTLTLQDASLTGAISTAVATSATGVKPTEKTYYLIGDVKNAFGPAVGPFGLAVAVGGHSSWVVDKTCYLTKLAIAPGATISAPPGYQLHLSVGGHERSLRPGTYSGQIVLEVSRARA